VAEVVAFKYRAFLSYSHRDTTWAKWLHGALERYRIGRDLVGRETPAGPVPETLRPIFRDREDFSAGHSLTEQTMASLHDSQFLVVLCSPDAAKSQYVNEEVRSFKAMGRANRVIPVIVAGEPGDPEHECFPPAVRFKLNSDGTLSEEREEPIAADARRQGDGKRIAFEKVLAGLLGLSFDDVAKREAIADARRIKIMASAAAVFIVVTMVAGYFVWHASEQSRREAALIEEQKRRDDEQRKRDEEFRTQLAAMQADYRALAGKLVGGAPQAAPGQAQAVREAVAATVQGAAEGDERLKRALALLDENKIEEASVLLRQVAEEKEQAAKISSREAAAAYRHLGAIAGLADPKRALEAYEKALQLDPDDVDSLVGAGQLQLERGQLDDAERRLRRVVSVARDGQKSHRHWAQLGLGDILVQRGDLTAALREYQQAAEVADRLAKADPGNAVWQRDLSVSHNKVGDVLVAQGNLAEALTAYRDSLTIAERLAHTDPGNAVWQHDLLVSHNKVGDVLVAQGNLAEALTAYRDSLAIAERLAKADPGNATWQRDLSVPHNKVGDVLVTQGNLAEALTAYRDSLAIRERLAKADPGNAGWQRDLSVSYNNVGDVLVQQGNLAEALTGYRDSLAIRERLAKVDPGNAGWQRDLSVSYNKVGDVLVQQGNLAEALTGYRDSLAIRERLAKADPGNAGWQRDLSVSYNNVGDVLVQQGNLAEALTGYRGSLAIRERLAKADPGNAGWQRDLSVSYSKVGAMLAVQGSLTEALEHYRADLAIAERLAGLDPSNADWQRDLRISRDQVVSTLRKLKAEDKLTTEQAKWLAEAEALPTQRARRPSSKRSAVVPGRTQRRSGLPGFPLIPGAPARRAVR
jgi:tetratricopeptide (TPR) repeat protein